MHQPSEPTDSGYSPEEAGLIRGVFSVLPDPVMVLDSEGRYLWVSRGAVESQGLSLEKMLGRKWHEVSTDAFSRRVFQDFWEAAVDRREPVREDVARPGQEGLRHFDVTLSPIFHGDGNLKAMILISRDTTQRKAVEEMLRQTEEQLRHVQRMDALGRLAGGIAHDFNNLMTVVNGYSDLLLQTLPEEAVPEIEGSESARALVSEIRKAGEKAAMLTNQLLGFSRKQARISKALSLNQVVMDMEKMLRRSLPGPIELVTGLSEEAGHVLGDPGHVAQVLMNLVLNARDAMPKGGTIRITTSVVRLTGEEAGFDISPAPGLYSTLSVEDDGIGIGPEIRCRLFEPFFSTKEKGKGTGLGLSTVFGIVKENAGGLSVRSQPRKGSVFTVYWRRADSPAHGRSDIAAVATSKSTGPRQGTILVVEDEEPVRRLVAGILTAEGYQVVEAENGPKAMETFVALGEDIDLVLTDIIMPGMSGRELVQGLKTLQPALKVIFMSGYIDDDAFLEGLGEGSDPFVAKPFSPQDLASKVREVLEGRQEFTRKPN